MQKMISRVLVFGRQPDQRARAVAALSRCAVETVEAANLENAVEILASDELPGLVVIHPDYQSESGPLALYNDIRTRPATHDIPVLLLVETSFERATVQTMNLERCACCLTPLSHAALIFALPSLELGIRDSVLFEQKARNTSQPDFALPSRHTNSLASF